MAREDLHPTDHLIEKMKERDVSWGEIIDVVNRYENSYGPDEKGRMIFQKGNLCVVAERNGAIVTVLLRSEKQWDADDVRTRGNEVLILKNERRKKMHEQRSPKSHSHYKRKKKQKNKGDN